MDQKMEKSEALPSPIELSKEEQAAWKDLSQELIFNDPSAPELSPATAKEVSVRIQEQFLEVHNNNQKRFKDIMEDGFKKMDEAMDIILSKDPFTNSDKESKPDSPEVFHSFLQMNAFFGQYYGWGFTPKLTDKENDLKPNCLGNAILLGTYAKKYEEGVEMAITPDHPNVIVIRDGKRFILAPKGAKEILQNELEEKDGYAIYRTAGTEAEDPGRIMIITDFDKAVLYETLENLAVLTNVARGRYQYLLPGSKKEGEQIANKHKKSLLKADWHQIQEKLFPEISKAFSENKDEWGQEIERMQKIREIQFPRKLLYDMFMKGLSVTSLKEEDPIEGLKKIMNDSRIHGSKIVAFVVEDKALEANVPLDLKAFWESFKVSLLDRDEELREEILKNVKDNLGGN